AATFEAVARLAHEAATADAKNAKHRAQWISSLETHAFPALGEMQVAEIKVKDIADAIRPIWREIPETAARVLQRILHTLAYAEVHEWRGQAPSRKAVGLALGGQQRKAHHHP